MKLVYIYDGKAIMKLHTYDFIQRKGEFVKHECISYIVNKVEFNYDESVINIFIERT